MSKILTVCTNLWKNIACPLVSPYLEGAELALRDHFNDEHMEKAIQHYEQLLKTSDCVRSVTEALAQPDKSEVTAEVRFYRGKPKLDSVWISVPGTDTNVYLSGDSALGEEGIVPYELDAQFKQRLQDVHFLRRLLNGHTQVADHITRLDGQPIDTTVGSWVNTLAWSISNVLDIMGKPCQLQALSELLTKAAIVYDELESS